MILTSMMEAIHMLPQNWGRGQYCKACSLT